MAARGDGRWPAGVGPRARFRDGGIMSAEGSANRQLPLWPLRRTADAVAVLARQVGWHLPSTVSVPPQPAGLSGRVPAGAPSSLSDYLDTVAGTLQLEFEPVAVRLAEMADFL